MRRPPRRRKLPPLGGSRPAKPTPFKLEPRTKLILLVLVICPAILFLGVHKLRLYRLAKVEETRFKAAYHLNDEQLNRTNVLVEEHEGRYQALKERAEASRRLLDEGSTRTKDVTPELQRLFDQAQADRETCWTEEIEHHRRMSQAMNPEDGQRYLTEAETRYQNRQRDRYGLLVLPH